jgi:carbamoyl-phosphate synthase large subunit
LIELGFEIYSTSGTALLLKKNGIKVKKLFRLSEGRPNVVDMIKNEQIQMVINTPQGMTPRRDENLIRTETVLHGVPVITTMGSAVAALGGIRALREKDFEVRSLQSYAASLTD